MDAMIARCTALLAWLLLPACGRGSAGADDLPVEVSRLPGDTYLVSWLEPDAAGAAADGVDPLRALVDELGPWGLGLWGLDPSGLDPWSADDRDGEVHLRTDEVATGWDLLGDSQLFQAAWRARPRIEAERWLYCDLQCAVDLAMLRLAESEPAVQRLADGLALPTLEWAIAGSHRAAGEGLVGTSIEGRIRASSSAVGLVALIGPPVGVSLLGPRRASDRLRIDVRVQSEVARKMTDVWLSGDARLGSPADAAIAAFGPTLRQLVRHFDGRISLRIDAAGRASFAAGIREGAEERLAATLDRSLAEIDPYRWQVRGDLVASIDGDRLLISDGGVDQGSDERPLAETLTIESSAAAWIRRSGGELVTVKLRRDDEQTLSLRVSVSSE